MIQIEGLVTGIAQENCYLIYNEEQLLIVDPGAEAERLEAEITRLKKVPVAILLTHTHYDHIGAVEYLRNRYSIPVYVHPIEQSWLSDPVLNLSGLNPNLPDIVVQPAEHTFDMDETYTIADMTFTVRATPGHSIGSVSLIFDDFVVCGDALFAGSIGRTDLYSGNLEQLLDSIQTQLFTLPRELPAYPGHGLATTIGHEIDTNPFFN